MVGDDYVTLLRSTLQRARREYRCYECRREISKGEPHWYDAYTWLDEFQSHRVCPQCRAASRWLVAVCSGWLYGAVIEDLSEHVRDEPDLRSAALVRIVRYAGAGWKTRSGGLVGVAAVEDLTERAIASVREVGALA